MTRKVHRNHLRECVDVEAVSHTVVAQRRRNRQRQLLEKRIQNSETRHNLSSRCIAAVHLVYSRRVSGLTQVDLKDLRMTVVLPSSSRPSWRHAYSTRPDQCSFDVGSWNLTHHLSWMVQVVNQKGMRDGCFYRFKRTFLDNCSVETAPTNLRAVGDQTIFGFERTSMRLTNPKYFIFRRDHGTAPALAVTMELRPPKSRKS